MKKLALLFLAAMLCACSAKTPMPQNLAYPNCYSPVYQAENFSGSGEAAAIGAGKGFAAGTLTGLAAGGVSALFTGNPMNLVSGMAMGAAGGTVAGGVYGAMDGTDAKKDALIQMWSQQTGKQLYGLSLNDAAATASIQCYDKAYVEVQNALQNGMIDRQSADARFNEINQGRNRALALMGAGLN